MTVDITDEENPDVKEILETFTIGELIQKPMTMINFQSNFSKEFNNNANCKGRGRSRGFN